MPEEVSERIGRIADLNEEASSSGSFGFSLSREMPATLSLKSCIYPDLSDCWLSSNDVREFPRLSGFICVDNVNACECIILGGPCPPIDEAFSAEPK